MIYEYNAEQNKARVLEACRVHGISELDYKNVPYMNQAIRIADQICDRIPITVAKE